MFLNHDQIIHNSYHLIQCIQCTQKQLFKSKHGSQNMSHLPYKIVLIVLVHADKGDIYLTI